MPSPFGTGEPVSRLRRLLDLRGKFPMSIDETLVPVVLLGDGTELPYRVSGRRWWATAGADAIVANNSWVEIRNLTPFVHKLDRLTVVVNTAVGTSTFFFAVDVGASQATVAGAVNAQTTEIRGTEVPATGTEGIGLILVPNQGLPGGLRIRLVSTPPLTINQSQSLDIEDLDLAIPPGKSINVICLTQQQAISISASGRFFDDVPRIAG